MNSLRKQPPGAMLEAAMLGREPRTAVEAMEGQGNEEDMLKQLAKSGIPAEVFERLAKLDIHDGFAQDVAKYLGRKIELLEKQLDMNASNERRLVIRNSELDDEVANLRDESEEARREIAKLRRDLLGGGDEIIKDEMDRLRSENSILHKMLEEARQQHETFRKSVLEAPGPVRRRGRPVGWDPYGD